MKKKDIDNTKKSNKLHSLALTVCCAMAGGIIGAATLALADIPSKTTLQIGQGSNTAVSLSYVDTSEKLTTEEVYAENVNSTVGITTSVQTNYFGYQTTSAASGSGFIISEDGYIITNYHVIEDAESITVTTYSGNVYAADLIGFDQSNDIAVLKINASGLQPVIIGDSSSLSVGNTVVAIGNPLGELTFSLTQGVISALDREITLENGTMMDLIQTDCAINSGNSGGALFNLYGEVIGITNAKYSSSSSSSASIDNIGFAIPINNVLSIIEDIIDDGYITKPYIGVSVTNVTSQNQAYGIPQGAAVASVTEESPAANAGLLVNDIITAADETEITGSSSLVKYIRSCEVGDTVSLTVYRQGQTLQLSITIGEQTISALEDQTTSAQSEESTQNNQQFGMPGIGNGQQSQQPNNDAGNIS